MNPKIQKSIIAIAFGSFVAISAHKAKAQSFHIQPYLQDVSQDKAWVLWETSAGDESTVLWGKTDSLGEESEGSFQPSEGDMRLHEVALPNLEPATHYFYRVRTGSLLSPIHDFRTPPLRSAEQSFRFVAFSDSQVDPLNPNMYARTINDGLIAHFAGIAEPFNQHIAFALVPGDLVEDGRQFETWSTNFFGPGQALMSQIPFYTALGNHEYDSPNYYRYFHTPENGYPTRAERFWAKSFGNVRLIVLNSNELILYEEQRSFFDSELELACNDQQTDFVFFAWHHAYRSEYYPNSQEPLPAQTVDLLNQYEARCHKPVVHFHGHTHGYARGASRDARHVWINVAASGGNLDYSREFDEQYDHDEISVSQDDWGFVVVDVVAGNDPSFTISRFSLGNELISRENEMRDRITIRRYDQAPQAPVGLSPRGLVQPSCATVKASPFVDADGQTHEATHWQINRNNCDFRDLAFEKYRTRENWFHDVDLQANDDLTDELASELANDFEGIKRFCWRVRYRDPGMMWSEWSTPVEFQFDANGAQSCVSETPLPASDAGVDAGAHPPKSGCAWSLRRDPSNKDIFFGIALALFLRARKKRSRN